MREVIACFPIYRTYLTGSAERATPGETALRSRPQSARRGGGGQYIDPSVFALHPRARCCWKSRPDQTEAERVDRLRFAMKFQQLTGPVMAKGIEDTVFYIYNRLTSLNEVGGEPATFGQSRRDDPRAIRRAPGCLARCDALLVDPRHEAERGCAGPDQCPLRAAARLAGGDQSLVPAQPQAPEPGRGCGRADRNDEYLLYQTLLGAWPIGLDQPDDEFRDRILAYMDKAIREAQVNTSWTNPNEAYDAATTQFIRAILDPKQSREFLDDFAAMRSRVCRVGIFTSLAQQLLKLTAPGVPDIYQGTELWDFSLVDPDNRRPVDYPVRIRQLRALGRRKSTPRLAEDLTVAAEDGRIKLYLTATALAFRAEQADLFARGSYQPLDTAGERAGNVFAFARELDGRQIVVIVPRLVDSLLRGGANAPIGSDVWGNTMVHLPEPDGEVRYRDLFTGTEIAAQDSIGVADALAHFPVAYLIRTDGK